MKKVSIIYWSNGGNVEILANAISEGVNSKEVEVETKHVADATIEDILEAINLDKKKLSELNIKNKPLVLFGSCGWRDTKFIDKWGNLMEDYGFEILSKFTDKDSVEKEDLKIAKELGKLLSQQ